MKKLFTLIAAAVMISAPAHAFLGLLFGNAPLIVVGAVLAAADSGVVVHCVSGPHFSHCSQSTYVTGTAGLVGLLLLDGEQGQNVAFSALSDSDATQLGITDSNKVAAYNHELAEINAVREDILSDVLIRSNNGEDVKTAEIHAGWLDAKAQGLISPAAFEVLGAVSKQAAQK